MLSETCVITLKYNVLHNPGEWTLSRHVYLLHLSVYPLYFKIKKLTLK
jgi:hypothetical protein